MKDFILDEKVRFDCHEDLHKPRWNFGQDDLHNDNYIDPKFISVEGKVISVDLDLCTVEWLDKKGNRLIWDWPQPSHKNYASYYGKPGYLERVVAEKVVCHCDIVQLWNYGHNHDCPERGCHK